MKYFDLHVYPSFSEGLSTIEQIIDRAKLFGYSGICIVSEAKDFKKNMENRESIPKKGLEITFGFRADNKQELKKLVSKRSEFDILIAKGGVLEFNRKAVETPEVDILSTPEFGRIDGGVNHTMAKLASKNQVAIEINFREVLNSFKRTRAQIMQRISTNLMLCKKYEAPYIITSGAISHLHLRDPLILQSFGTLLGLGLDESKMALSKIPEEIITNSKKRQSKNWIMPGVEVVK
jgi:ribonuclease P/MRP protein subunit RPP1